MTTPRPIPQDLDMEMALLGAVFANPDVVDDVLATIGGTIDVFYLPAHMHIWNGIARLHAAGSPIDLVSLSADLFAHDLLESVGGQEYMVGISESCPDSTQAAYYAQEVLKVYKRRSLIQIAPRLLDAAYAPLCDPDSTASEYASKIEAVATQSTGQDVEDVLKVIERTADEIASGNSQGRVTTGMTRFDSVLGGLPRGCMTILAACTSVGKTSLALQWCLNAIANDVPALFFTSEMSKERIGNRIVTHVSGQSDRDINEHGMNGTLRIVQAHVLPDLLYVSDCTTDVGRIIPLSRMYVRTYGVKLIVVDYLQLCTINERFHSTNDRVSAMSKGLKRMATDTGVALLVLSQFSRDVARSGRRPKLFDLRDSGAIEEDADLALLMSRDEGPGYDSIDPECNIILDAAKNRNGTTGIFPLVFEKARMRFRSEAVRAVEGCRADEGGL